MKKISVIAFLAAACLMAGCGGGAGKAAVSAPETAASESTAETAAETETETASETEASGPDMEAAAGAYLSVLEENRQYFDLYSWQNLYGLHTSERRPVVITDVTGDDMPELIYTTASRDPNKSGGVAELHVYTFRDDAAQEIFFDEFWDVSAAGGTRWALFKEQGSDQMYGYTSMGDENWTYEFLRFDVGADGQLSEVKELVCDGVLKEDYSGMVYTITNEAGEALSEEAYEEKKQEYCDHMSLYLTGGNLDNEGLAAAADRVSEAGMTYSEAITYLKSFLPGTEAGSGDLFEMLDGKEFMFASGAGAWMTLVDFQADGFFFGNFHDTDMGDTSGGDAHATVQICDFSGLFTDAQKIDDHSYSMTLEYISVEDKPGEEWTEDQIHYIASAPYGLEESEGKSFTVYLPGTPAEQLPEECLNWIGRPAAWGASVPETLPFYVLYNVEKQYGFSSSEEERGEAEDDFSQFLDICCSEALDPAYASRVEAMSSEEIQLYINGIYARHGYRFKDEGLLDYFSQYSWYSASEADMAVVQAGFSSVEKANVDYLAAHK